MPRVKSLKSPFLRDKIINLGEFCKRLRGSKVSALATMYETLKGRNVMARLEQAQQNVVLSGPEPGCD